MKRIFNIVLAVCCSALIISGCGAGTTSDSADPSPLTVDASPPPMASSSPGVDESSSDGGLEDPDTDSDPVFYLSAEPGCYSYGPDPAQPWFIDAIGKELYPQPCDGAHTTEVIYAGDSPEFTSEKNLTQADAERLCVAAYVDAFGVEPPESELESSQQMETPYLLWFFPDDGLEARKFPGRIICLVVVTTADFAKADSITGSRSDADA